MKHPESPISYKSEIDGLRAIAVIAVILFHLSKETFPGGYLGVDIFFVISGFLITRIISKQALSGTFSFAKFYKRRVKRIIPVLSCVLLATTCVSAFLLLPSDLVGYSRSLISSIFFFSNIYFWRDTNYFSPNAETKPLLHIWSLSLEEQFYVVFPALLILSYRFMKRRAWIVVLAATLGSLCLYIFLNRIGGGSPAFFLLPTRAWQFGLGAIAGLFNWEPRRTFGNALSSASIIVLIASAFHIIPLKTVSGAMLTSVSAAIFLALTSVHAQGLSYQGPLKLTHGIPFWGKS